MPKFLFVGGAADGMVLDVEHPEKLISVHVPRKSTALMSADGGAMISGHERAEYEAMKMIADETTFIIYIAVGMTHAAVFKSLLSNYRPRRHDDHTRQ